MSRIYLDNAATSWPKPEAVYQIVDRCQRELGAAAGRGGSREAAEVGRLMEEARGRIAELIGAEHPRQIAFTFNGTDSLNLAIHGTLRPGDHVVTTVLEHNSILRPLRNLQEAGTILVSYVPCNAEGIVDPQAVEDALTPQTRMIAMLHASNVTGAIQPAAEVGEIAKRRGVLYLLDAAQSVGHLPLNVAELQADFLAAPTHKGLLGPLGGGFLYVAPGREEQLAAIRQGGTGTRSEDDRQPLSLPDKYESGNHNTLAILGAGAGAAFVQQRGMELLREEQRLTRVLWEGLRRIPQVSLYGPEDPQKRLGVVSFNMEGVDPRELAAALDAACSVQIRAGVQCAPRMHQALGTTELGGTARMSLGAFNTEEQLHAAIEAVEEIAEAF